MQRTVRWLSRRHHLIQWEERGLSYDEGYRVITPTESTVVYETKCILVCHNEELNAKCALRSALHYYDCLIKPPNKLKSALV